MIHDLTLAAVCCFGSLTVALLAGRAFADADRHDDVLDTLEEIRQALADQAVADSSYLTEADEDVIRRDRENAAWMAEVRRRFDHIEARLDAIDAQLDTTGGKRWEGR